MSNAFDVNRAVAMSHVQTEQLKGWFLAKSRLMVIMLSGSMLFLGVVLLVGNLHFALTLAFAVSLVSVLPIAVVAALLAVVIEGGTVFSSNLVHETLDKRTKALDALEKVKAKYTAAEIQLRKKQIRRGTFGPFVLLLVCVAFSTLGAEIFWQKLMDGQSPFFHVIGAVLGLVCSTLLVVFELKSDMIERIVERSISSSALIGIALDMSAKSQIYNKVFETQHEFFDTPEVEESLRAANYKRLNGVLATTVSINGVSVTAEQIGREVKRAREERAAADAYLAKGDESLLAIDTVVPGPDVIEIKRKPKTRIAAEKLVSKYGLDRVSGDMDKYATEASMDVRTLQKHLQNIASAA